MDSFLVACIEYFAAFFELQKLLSANEDAAKDKDKDGKGKETTVSQVGSTWA